MPNHTSEVSSHSSAHCQPIAIIGLGLIGGSIAKKLAQHNIEVLAYDPILPAASVLTPAEQTHITFFATLKDLLTSAQITSAMIIIAVPLPAITDVFHQIATFTTTCYITDVTSVKVPVHHIAAQYKLSHRFIGGHPMCGTEFSGWQSSTPDLFVGKRWVITTSEDDENDAAIIAVQNLATQCQAVPIIMSAADHDHTVAITSHLPHIFSDTLSILADHNGTPAFTLSAGSFNDATRVSRTRPELIHAMLTGNAPALVPVLDQVIAQLQQLRSELNEYPTSTSTDHRDNSRILSLNDFVTAGFTAKKACDDYHNYQQQQLHHRGE